MNIEKVSYRVQADVTYHDGRIDTRTETIKASTAVEAIDAFENKLLADTTIAEARLELLEF